MVLLHPQNRFKVLYSQRGSFHFFLLHPLWGGGNSLLISLLLSILLAHYYPHSNHAYDLTVTSTTFWGWYCYQLLLPMGRLRLRECNLPKVAELVCGRTTSLSDSKSHTPNYISVSLLDITPQHVIQDSSHSDLVYAFTSIPYFPPYKLHPHYQRLPEHSKLSHDSAFHDVLVLLVNYLSFKT